MDITCEGLDCLLEGVRVAWGQGVRTSRRAHLSSDFSSSCACGMGSVRGGMQSVVHWDVDLGR